MLASPLKRIGGKHALAQQLLKVFPPDHTYTRYCEPCGGAAWVLLARQPGLHEEIFNDLDDLLMNFWETIRDQGDLLRSRLDGVLYSRYLYSKYYRSLFNGTQLDPVEKAARWFYCLRATGTGWLRRSPVGWDYRPGNLSSYHHALTLFEEVHQRFQGVVTDNRDVLATIRRYDSPQTFFYLDPPYLGSESYYEASKKGFPHEEMATLLQTVQGKVALSYYPHPLLDCWYAGWRRCSWEQRKPSQIQIPERNDRATELLLCNYEESPEPAPEPPAPELVTLWDGV